MLIEQLPAAPIPIAGFLNPNFFCRLQLFNFEQERQLSPSDQWLPILIGLQPRASIAHVVFNCAKTRCKQSDKFFSLHDDSSKGDRFPILVSLHMENTLGDSMMLALAARVSSGLKAFLPYLYSHSHRDTNRRLSFKILPMLSGVIIYDGNLLKAAARQITAALMTSISMHRPVRERNYNIRAGQSVSRAIDGD